MPAASYANSQFTWTLRMRVVSGRPAWTALPRAIAAWVRAFRFMTREG